MSNNRKQKAKSFIKQKSNYDSWFLRSSDAAIQAAQEESKRAEEQGQQKYQQEKGEQRNADGIGDPAKKRRHYTDPGVSTGHLNAYQSL